MRDPGDGGSGGSGADGAFTMSDLNDPSKTGHLSDTDKAAALETAQKLEQETISKEALETDGTLKPGYLKDATTGKISKDANYKAPDAPIEGLDDKGELLEGYIKDTDGKVIKDPDYKEPEVDEVKAFYDRLNTITGRELEVKYPDNVDPLSPDGIAIYAEAVREDAILGFDEYLKTKDPRSYAYMLHRAAGGDDETFMGAGKGFVLPTKEELDASADLQIAVFKYDMKSRELDDSTIDLIIKDAIAKNLLKEKATVSFTTIGNGQKQQLENITKVQQQREAAVDNAIKGMTTTLDKVITEGMRLVVPETDKQVFKKFVTDSLRFDTEEGKFFLVQDIGTDNITSMLESLFYQFKKGDFKALIQKQVKTDAAQSIRARMTKQQQQQNNGKSGDGTSTKYIPLGDITKA
jgi:hypothetical protein